jgi:hypothetical protein
MPNERGSEEATTRRRHWWPVPFLAGLGLVFAVIAVSASTAASPNAYNYQWTRLSARDGFAAYPDIATGSGGLVAAVWTEGADTIVKHNGPLKLAWVDNNSSNWKVIQVDGNTVYDAAVAASGSTIHVVWTRPKNTIRYTRCAYDVSSSNYVCDSSQQIAVTPVTDGEALQADIVIDGSGTPHVVWVETAMNGVIKVHKLYYSRKEGSGWRAKQLTNNSSDSEGPAIAYANGYIHVVWTEWLNSAHIDSQVNYCRRGVNADNWSVCFNPLSAWPVEDYLARNLSIAADSAGNVYAVWDVVSVDDGGSRRQYAIAYKHATGNGENWQPMHTYPDGNDLGRSSSGTTIFRSGELGDLWVEYVQFLRPHVSLVQSGGATVPVLTWHAQYYTGGGEPGMVQALATNPHKVYWTYATQPGSYSKSATDKGYMYWATEYYTVSTDLCGNVHLNSDSATGRLALVGDLNEILEGESPGNHLHAVYHEEIGDGFWGVYYNNSKPQNCFGVRMPLLLRNHAGGED